MALLLCMAYRAMHIRSAIINRRTSNAITARTPFKYQKIIPFLFEAYYWIPIPKIVGMVIKKPYNMQESIKYNTKYYFML